MNKEIARFTVLTALLFLSHACADTHSVDVTVVSEGGIPVSNAEVTVEFLGVTGSKDVERSGLSGREGQFSARGDSTLGVQVFVDKEGFYRSYIERLSRKKDHVLSVVLRKKGDAQPLYAKKAFLDFPVNRRWIGYDLQAGDWVAPFGSGSVIDVEFRCDTESKGVNQGFEDGSGVLEMRFMEGGGIAKVGIDEGYLSYSEMKMPHEAPEGGYEIGFRREEESFRSANVEADIGFFLRVRAEVTKQGEVKFAHYAKILDDIKFSPRWKTNDSGKIDAFATVWFTYYYNPERNDRNLEFDPNRNLFTDLRTTWQVRSP